MEFWAPYVPVAEQRARARREMARLKKKGKHIRPVEIDGRAIARSFWGKGWCDHLESFADFANRLPRGRRYVRNGSVCHLEIRPGRVEAIVSGSELYDVTIGITQLKAAAWTSIKAKCAGRIGSMLELLQGKLSRQVMGVVTERDRGLFPKPREIALDCSCPDWAAMCKHVAAALYGVGHRLDHQPDLLFVLRDVDAAELIATEIALPGREVTSDVLADEALGDIFGIDLDAEEDAFTVPRGTEKEGCKTKTVDPPEGRVIPEATERTRRHAPRRRSPRKGLGREPRKRRQVPLDAPNCLQRPLRQRVARRGSPRPEPSRLRVTGAWIVRLRRKHNLSVAEFARQLGVSTSTVYRWELASGNLNPQRPRPGGFASPPGMGSTFEDRALTPFPAQGPSLSGFHDASVQRQGRLRSRMWARKPASQGRPSTGGPLPTASASSTRWFRPAPRPFTRAGARGILPWSSSC